MEVPFGSAPRLRLSGLRLSQVIEIEPPGGGSAAQDVESTGCSGPIASSRDPCPVIRAISHGSRAPSTHVMLLVESEKCRDFRGRAPEQRTLGLKTHPTCPVRRVFVWERDGVRRPEGAFPTPLRVFVTLCEHLSGLRLEAAMDRWHIFMSECCCLCNIQASQSVYVFGKRVSSSRGQV